MQYQNQMQELDPILRYKMDDMEAKAFKIALIWQDECKSELTGEKFERLVRGKDPRKSNLFRHCYKLAKETKGIIPDKDLRLYVRAQIQILKSIREGKVHALISPHCLVGDKAWKRWKVWKRIYDGRLNVCPTADQLLIRLKESMVISDLEKTFVFLESRGFHDRHNYFSGRMELERWNSTREISPFYFMLSPWAKEMFEELPVDAVLHRASITPSVENIFRERFFHEFS